MTSWRRNMVVPEPSRDGCQDASISAPPRRSTRRYWFQIFWFAVVLLHVLSAAYLLIFASFHVVLNTQTYFMRQLAVKTHPNGVALLYVVVSAVHMRRVWTILCASLQHRTLCFERINLTPAQPPPQLQQRKQTSALTVILAAASAPQPSRWVLSWSTTGAQLWQRYFGRCGLFGIFGKHGDARIWCVEFLNLGAHIFQATRWSRFWRPGAYFTVAALLSCECLVPAYYHKANRTMSDALRARLVLLDIAIDTLLCVVIPTWLVAPFVLQYLDKPHVVNSNYAETWYAEGVLSFKQSLATTLLDLVTKVSPFCLNYLSLVEISSGQHRSTPMLQSTHVAAASTLPLDSRFSSVQTSTILVPTTTAASLSACSDRAGTRWWPPASRTCAFWVLRLSFVAWSVIFFLMTLSASGWVPAHLPACHQDCLLATYPWFTHRCSCIAQEINCAKLNISGTTGLERTLTEYADGESTVVLIVNRCRNLVMPSTIRKFPNLLGIHVYSSELMHWGDDAALTADAFTAITYIVFVNSTVSTIPRGLLTNLAPTVQDIEIIASSTPVVVPDDLHELWPHVGTLYIEHCNLTAFPAPLLKMRALKQLSLAGNGIAELPTELFAAPLFESLTYLVLSANPALAHVPTRLDAAQALLELYVDATNVSTLDVSTVAESNGLRISAARTPLCNPLDSVATNSSSNISSSNSSRIVCAGLYGGMYTLGVYPLLPAQRAARTSRILPSDELLQFGSDA